MCINLTRELIRPSRPERQHRGFTLIEMIIFIVVVSVGLVGVLSVLQLTAGNSAAPVIRKNMLAIAEGLLEEISAQPFTWCDPNDANVTTATSASACTTAEAMGPEAGETRGNAGNPFDNVNDYYVAGGWTLNPVSNIVGDVYAGYSAVVTISQEALGDVPVADSLRIAVTVTRGTETMTLETYRVRHSPNLP